MSDIKLFRVDNGRVEEIEGQSVAVEKSLQHLIERHLEDFFGIRFLASEYSTGRRHGGRIDTLGIDENNCPVIIEYKRSVNENVINQGLYYLDWLLDHRGEYALLVRDRVGREVADGIEWSIPRLICIAGDFTKYDQYAVEQINRNIELTRYTRYGDDLVLFELVNTTSADSTPIETDTTRTTTRASQPTFLRNLERASTQLRDLYEELGSLCVNLGDDIQVKPLKHYIAYRRFRNFACVEVHPQAEKLNIYLKVDPNTVRIEPGFTRDMREIGHYGTGDLEVTITSRDDLRRAEPLLVRSYEQS